MGKFTPLDFEEYVALARQAAAEGCVLLKNDNEALPLRKGDKVAVFGRIAFHYYKSGLGSGGLVNTKYVVGILDALKEEKDITLDENLLGTYEKWIEENPYDEGQGWGKVPWSQKEMELTDGAMSAMALWHHFGPDITAVCQESTHGKILSGLGFDNDLFFCGEVDSSSTVPVLKDVDGVPALVGR